MSIYGGTAYGSQYKDLGKLVADVNKIIFSGQDGFPPAKPPSSPSRPQPFLRDDYQPKPTETIDLDPDDIRPPTWFDKSLIDDKCRPTPPKIICPEDPFDSRPSTGFVVPQISAFGGSDLSPGPGAGMYPTRGDNSRGSMLVGPHDPMFFEAGIREPGSPGALRVPPSARFDPYGPPDVSGFEPDRFGSPSWDVGDAHPDPEHFLSDLEHSVNGGDFIM